MKKILFLTGTRADYGKLKSLMKMVEKDSNFELNVFVMAHFHLVANDEAKKRILQLGEKEESVFVFGSPELDIMYSDTLPNMDEVKDKYEIPFETFSILMYHPVTTEG